MKKRLILLFFIVFSLMAICIATVNAEDVPAAEDYFEEVGDTTTKTLTNDEIKALIESGIEAYKEGNTKGWLEENIGTILASCSGVVVGLAILLYWVFKALRESKKLIEELEKDGKINKENANNLKQIEEKIEQIINEKLNEVLNKAEQVGEVKEEFRNTIAKLQESDKEWFEILKLAFCNDAGATARIKELIDEYGRKHITTKENESDN